MKMKIDTNPGVGIMKKIAFLVAAVLTVSSLFAAQVAALAPPAPVIPVGGVIVHDAGRVEVTWTNVAGEASYRIQRSLNDAFTTPVEFTVGADVTSYLDTTTQAKTRYFYRVFAMNADGSSPPSNVVTILTPASVPQISLVQPTGGSLQSGANNTISGSFTVSGATIASAEYQYMAQDAPGTFTAQDIMFNALLPTDFVVPATIATAPVNNIAPVPANLPSGSIVEFEIRGRVTSVTRVVGAIGPNEGRWTIGDGPTQVNVYEANSGTGTSATNFVGKAGVTPDPARPGLAIQVGDVVKVIAHRTINPGPLVAESIRFLEPAPATIPASNPPSIGIAFLYEGLVKSISTDFQTAGVTYSGTIWTVGGPTTRPDIRLRVDDDTYPAFPAFIDAGLSLNNSVTVRFWAPPATSPLIAREIFARQSPPVAVVFPPIINQTPEYYDFPVPLGLPEDTYVQYIVFGVIAGFQQQTFTWHIGDPAVPAYGHSNTLIFERPGINTLPGPGDEVTLVSKRTQYPGPLIVDHVNLMTDGPAAPGALAEVRTIEYYTFDGTVVSMGPHTWTIQGTHSTETFVVDDLNEPAVIDRGDQPAIRVGSQVSVEFHPAREVLPLHDNWAPMSQVGTTNEWTATTDLPAVANNRNGVLFLRTTDSMGESRTSRTPVQLLGPTTMKVFVRGTDNGVWYQNWDGISGTWQSLGGVVDSDISATSSGSNTTIFVRGADNALWTQNWNGAIWSGWQPLGGVIAGEPESVSAGLTYVFARGSDNAVWYRNGTPGAMNPYQSLGGVAASNISATSSGSNIDIFVRRADNALWTQNWNGAIWSGWQPLGGVIAGDPESVSAGLTYVFVRGSDNAVWYRNGTAGAWNPYQSLGGVVASDISATSSGSNIDIFVRGTDNALWTQNWNGSAWSGWQPLGGVTAGNPDSISGGLTPMTHVFVRGSDNAVWTRNGIAGAMNPYQSLGGAIRGDPESISG